MTDKQNDNIVSEDELTDMFGEGGKEEVKEFYLQKCECDEEATVEPEREYQYSEEEKSGMFHKPNECKGTNNIKKYRRGDKELYLCSCCNMPGDIEIKEIKKDDKEWEDDKE